MTNSSVYILPGVITHKDPISVLTSILADYNVTWTFVCSESRKREALKFRQAIQVILYRETGLSLQQVGNLTGGINHCTILYSLKVIDNSEDVFKSLGIKDETYILFTDIRTKFVEMTGGRLKKWQGQKKQD